MILIENPTGFALISLEINIPNVGLKEPTWRTCQIFVLNKLKDFHMVAVNSCYIQGKEPANALYLRAPKSLLYQDECLIR